MKILLSAYACEPNKGSEPGVGWNWALALARRGYDVHVVTRSNNREAIEASGLGSSLHFYYFDFPKWARFWKYWPGGIYLYYLLWQVGVYRIAKQLHARERFDLVHHITFVSYRQPSLMGRLGIPFVFGPVGGGEAMPAQLRASLPLHARMTEALRDAGNLLVTVDPLVRRTYGDADVIACATEETLFSIPAPYRSKCMVQRAIGIDEAEIERGSQPDAGRQVSGARTQFLFVGRLLYWKGLHLALRALELVKAEVPDVRLRVIGEGGDRGWLEQVARRAEVADRVEWVPHLAHDAMRGEYRDSVGLVFPSLHDSGGLVVVEALASGLPVICLDLGGPGSIVSASCGIAVQPGQKSETEIIRELAAAMIRLSREPEVCRQLSRGARQRARELTWEAAAAGVYSAPAVAVQLSSWRHVSD